MKKVLFSIVLLSLVVVSVVAGKKQLRKICVAQKISQVSQATTAAVKAPLDITVEVVKAPCRIAFTVVDSVVEGVAKLCDFSK